MQKVYVEVTAHFDTIGNVKPLSIVWENGKIFDIDRVLDTRRAASTKVGGVGLRYRVRILGKETYLFYENPRWFVESKT